MTSWYWKAKWLPDWRVIVLRGQLVRNYDRFSFWQRLKAVIGVDRDLGYCSRHRLYYHQYDLGVYDEFWLCPECYHNALERYRSRK